MTPSVPQELMQLVASAAGDRVDLVDWDAMRRAGLAASGVPTPIAPAPVDLEASR